MSDLNLGKLLLGKQQEKQVEELLTNLTELVTYAHEVLINANRAIESINEITDKLKSVLK